jgi:(2Fe-2S) ferredoxin
MMPRIQDIGVFNSVREAGLAKLTPAVPRITVGMGTCGRGNGAEEVFHALNEGIQRGGLDVLLASVGCFGSCFQEPLVGVRLPGNPLVILRRVQANDAGRILEGVTSGTCQRISSTARSKSGTTSRRISAMARAIPTFLRGMPCHSSRGKRKSFCATAA